MLIRTLSVAALLAYFTIVLGAATRVFDAGMACPDWPLCYGVLVPFPEPVSGYWVQGIHYQWWQVALEWGHRLGASVTGLLTLLGCGWFWWRKKTSTRWLALLPLLLLVLQVKLGGLTVFVNNIHWSVAMHLGVAMLFFGGLIVLRRLAARSAEAVRPPLNKALLFAGAALAGLVWCTMIIGAMVSSSHAGGLCGGLFSCQGVWWPQDFGQQWHMAHRALAVLTTLAVVLVFVLAKKAGGGWKKSAFGLKILLLGQLALGVATLYSFAYYPAFYQLLSVAHLAWGTLLWLASVGFLLKVILGHEGSFHQRG